MLCASESFITLFLSMRPAPKVQTRTPWKHQKPYVLVSNLPDGLSDRWNRKVQEYVMHPDKKLNKVKKYEFLLLVRPRKFSRYVLCVTAKTI